MLVEVLANLDDFSAESVEQNFKKFLEDNSLGMGAVLPNFRLLVTGQGMGPSMFAISELLGKEEIVGRMKNGINKMAHVS